MKSLRNFILEQMDDNSINFVWTIYDKKDGTIVGVADDEASAKSIADNYESQGEDYKTEIKKEKKDSVEK